MRLSHRDRHFKLRGTVCGLGQLVLASALSFSLSACSWSGTTPVTRDENNIGTQVDAISALVAREGAAQDHVTVFDPTIRMIHQFSVAPLTYERTWPVSEPDADHFLLYHNAANYVIDLTKKHLTIFNRAGVAQKDPVRLQGVPRSAAFRPSVGADPARLEAFLAIYDDLGSVGLLILDADGNVSAKTALGPIVASAGTGDADITIAAGDLTEDGRLVLSLSDDRIAVVDVRASIAQNKWVTIALYPSTLRGVTWVAPLKGEPGRIFVKSIDRLALLDIDQQSVIDSYDASAEKVVLLSKSMDPHVGVTTSMRDERKILYVDASKIRSRSFRTMAKANILASMLDLTSDTWSLITSETPFAFSSDQDPVDQVPQRRLVRFRFTDQLSLQNKDLPDRARLRMTKTSIFALFPSDLGSAVNYSTMDDSQSEQHGFNRPFIH